MASSLHEQLKHAYADDPGRTEVVLGEYRIDAMRGDELVEVQCASLAAISEKCNRLLRRHRLCVVKPVVFRTRISKRKVAGGPVVSRRLSPKRGSLLDLFEELIYFTRVFPNPNLTIEVPLVHVEQFRSPRKKKRRRSWQKDFHVDDVRLEKIESTVTLASASDLLDLLGIAGDDPLWAGDAFNTADLAKSIGTSRHASQQIAYVLRKTGAIDTIGRKRTGVRYRAAA